MGRMWGMAAAAALSVCAWAGGAVAQTATVTFEGTVSHADGVFAANIGKPFTAELVYGLDTGILNAGGGYKTVEWALGRYTISFPVSSSGTTYMAAGYYSSPSPSVYFSAIEEDWWGGIGFNRTTLSFGFGSGSSPAWFPADIFTPFKVNEPGVFGGGLSWELFDPVFDAYGSGTMSFDVSTATLTSSVPEPSTWAMMLIGFAGLTLVQRHRRDGLAA